MQKTSLIYISVFSSYQPRQESIYVSTQKRPPVNIVVPFLSVGGMVSYIWPKGRTLPDHFKTDVPTGSKRIIFLYERSLTHFVKKLEARVYIEVMHISQRPRRHRINYVKTNAVRQSFGFLIQP